MARVNPAARGLVLAHLTPLAERGAAGGAGVLREKLGGEGSGRQYAGLPNRSSAQQEYPAEQTGALRDSIDSRAAGPGRAEFGPIDDPPPETIHLHFRPPEDGGRPFMDDALHDRDVRRAVAQAMGVKP